MKFGTVEAEPPLCLIVETHSRVCLLILEFLGCKYLATLRGSFLFWVVIGTSTMKTTGSIRLLNYFRSAPRLLFSDYIKAPFHKAFKFSFLSFIPLSLSLSLGGYVEQRKRQTRIQREKVEEEEEEEQVRESEDDLQQNGLFIERERQPKINFFEDKTSRAVN